jgi:hypothetical protein
MSPSLTFPNQYMIQEWTPDEYGMTYKNITVISPESDDKGSPILKLHGWFAYHQGNLF